MIDIYLPHSGIYKVDEIFVLLKNQMGPNSSNANLAALNYDVRRLNSIDEPIDTKEFRIALRVGGDYYKKTGINLYHFMWQTANGQWASKYGDLNASELLPVGITPEDVAWKDGSYDYDSETLYLAVFPRE